MKYKIHANNSRCVAAAIGFLATALLTAPAAEVWAQTSFDYATVDVPGLPGAVVSSVNNRGQMVGYYIEPLEDRQVGFVLDGGVATPLDVPGALHTAAWSINDRGHIAAYAIQEDWNWDALVIAKGEFSWFDAPLEGDVSSIAQGINNRNEIAGFAFSGDLSSDDLVGYGYVLDTKSGDSMVIAHPDAVWATLVTGMNDLGQVIGYYWNADFERLSFVLEDGVFHPITGPNGEEIYLSAINNRGQIAGYYFGADFEIHGFVLERGVFHLIDVPDSLPGFSPVFGMNNRGQVVGQYIDSDFKFRVFLATPKP